MSIPEQPRPPSERGVSDITDAEAREIINAIWRANRTPARGWAPITSRPVGPARPELPKPPAPAGPDDTVDIGGWFRPPPEEVPTGHEPPPRPVELTPPDEIVDIGGPIDRTLPARPRIGDGTSIQPIEPVPPPAGRMPKPPEQPAPPTPEPPLPLPAFPFPVGFYPNMQEEPYPGAFDGAPPPPGREPPPERTPEDAINDIFGGLPWYRPLPRRRRLPLPRGRVHAAPPLA